MSAETMMNSLNRRALAGQVNGQFYAIEDIKDSDGRLYRIEYRCEPDGSNAKAWVVYNPWGGNPYSYDESHLSTQGYICVGKGLRDGLSPYNLDFVARRARLWCEGFSFLQEHGYEATCRALPDWRG